MGNITAQRRQESWFALLQLARPFIVQGGAGVSTNVQLFRRWSNRAEARSLQAFDHTERSAFLLAGLLPNDAFPDCAQGLSATEAGDS
jgi:hypothetical protein